MKSLPAAPKNEEKTLLIVKPTMRVLVRAIGIVTAFLVIVLFPSSNVCVVGCDTFLALSLPLLKLEVSIAVYSSVIMISSGSFKSRIKSTVLGSLGLFASALFGLPDVVSIGVLSLGIGWIVKTVFEYRGTWFKVTNLRVIKIRKFISISSEDISYDSISQLVTSQGIIERLLHWGKVHIIPVSGDVASYESPFKVIPIYKPHRFMEKIQEARFNYLSPSYSIAKSETNGKKPVFDSWRVDGKVAEYEVGVVK